mmetsp:Transcript_9456/g.33802  ORF Transcript_9456/g.33802 Transcript_9456/m.33802 type:complete len:230 (+) Transcript_9456:1646-2335(+)
MTLESPQRARATLSLRFIPPLSSFTLLSFDARRPTSVRIEPTSFRAENAPLSLRKSSRCSRTVRSSQRMSNCGQIPTSFWTLSGFSVTSWPHRWAVPVVGCREQDSILIRVVFPAPFSPRRPKHSPRSTTRPTPPTATFPPKSLDRSRTTSSCSSSAHASALLSSSQTSSSRDATAAEGPSDLSLFDRISAKDRMGATLRRFLRVLHPSGRKKSQWLEGSFGFGRTLSR